MRITLSKPLLLKKSHFRSLPPSRRSGSVECCSLPAALSPLPRPALQARPPISAHATCAIPDLSPPFPFRLALSWLGGRPAGVLRSAAPSPCPRPAPRPDDSHAPHAGCHRRSPLHSKPLCPSKPPTHPAPKRARTIPCIPLAPERQAHLCRMLRCAFAFAAGGCKWLVPPRQGRP